MIALVIWEFEMLGIPEELGGYAGLDGISREPVRVFARFRKITDYKMLLSGRLDAYTECLQIVITD